MFDMRMPGRPRKSEAFAPEAHCSSFYSKTFSYIIYVVKGFLMFYRILYYFLIS